VYRKRRLPGPPSAQYVNFRLAPLFKEQNTSSAKHLSDANTWTVTGKSEKLPEFPIRNSTRETWLKLLSKLDIGVVSYSRSPISSPIPTPSMRSDSSYSTSSSVTPIPIFKRRIPTATFLIRRPTIEPPLPLKIDEELFESIVNSFELRALPFKRSTESYKFYITHFPLLLKGIRNPERCSTPGRKSKSPDGSMSALIARKREMNEKIVELEYMMKEMEYATDTDCKFVTELESAVFDPTTWDWNKVDVAGLKRRYTLEAMNDETK
jgi:hypothetical protein